MYFPVEVAGETVGTATLEQVHAVCPIEKNEWAQRKGSPVGWVCRGMHSETSFKV
jgi:hypothetical protein